MRSVVVVEPENPENIGFIARLCDNFGFKLRLVKPNFNLKDSRKTANNSQEVLRETEIYNNAKDSVKDLDFVLGTKPGKGISAQEFDFRKNTSLMLGRESSGLSKKELDLCDSVVHIGAPGYESLNLSHAASVLMYEASNASSKNIDGNRLEVIENKGGEKLRELIGRSSPSKGELDKAINELT